MAGVRRGEALRVASVGQRERRRRASGDRGWPVVRRGDRDGLGLEARPVLLLEHRLDDFAHLGVCERRDADPRVLDRESREHSLGAQAARLQAAAGAEEREVSIPDAGGRGHGEARLATFSAAAGRLFLR